MSFALLGAAAGASAVGQAVGFGFGALSAKKAWQRQKKVLKNQIQWRVEDLKAAGLNPILAAPGSIGGGGVNVAQGQLGSGGDIVGSAKTLAKLPDEVKILRKQVEIANNEAQRTYHAAAREGVMVVNAEYDALRNKVGLELDRSNLPAARSQEAMDRTKVGGYLRWFNRGMKSVWGKDRTTAK